ncbi:MAG: hypothetical protein JRG93_16960 [Deltaproteobacteria bacterium]|nr:hypothetical protein [Deltaproteobacteria bacterium]
MLSAVRGLDLALVRWEKDFTRGDPREDRSGTPYRIVCAPESAVAISIGRDKAFDTEDDISSGQP